jgi:hypothetical protein
VPIRVQLDQITKVIHLTSMQKIEIRDNVSGVTRISTHSHKIGSFLLSYHKETLSKVLSSVVGDEFFNRCRKF